MWGVAEAVGDPVTREEVMAATAASDAGLYAACREERRQARGGDKLAGRPGCGCLVLFNAPVVEYLIVEDDVDTLGGALDVQTTTKTVMSLGGGSWSGEIDLQL